MNPGSLLLIGAGVLGLWYGGTYLLKLNRLSNELETATKATIHSISLDGVELRIIVTLKNPSGGSVTVKHPFVKLIYGQKTLLSSEVRDVNITVPKFSEVNLDPITVKLGFINLAVTVPTLLKEFREQGRLTLTIKTITTINDTLPYTKTDEILLGSKQQA